MALLEGVTAFHLVLIICRKSDPENISHRKLVGNLRYQCLTTVSLYNAGDTGLRGSCKESSHHGTTEKRKCSSGNARE